MPKLSGKLRVFVVDDEPTIADTTTAILNREGFEACAIYSGEHAVRMASVIRPHVLVCDVMMPGMNGIQTSMRIRQIVPDCRIILITGHTAAGDLLKRAKETGFIFELLAKPIHPSVVLNCLKSLASDGQITFGAL